MSLSLSGMAERISPLTRLFPPLPLPARYFYLSPVSVPTPAAVASCLLLPVPTATGIATCPLFLAPYPYPITSRTQSTDLGRSIRTLL